MIDRAYGEIVSYRAGPYYKGQIPKDAEARLEKLLSKHTHILAQSLLATFLANLHRSAFLPRRALNPCNHTRDFIRRRNKPSCRIHAKDFRLKALYGLYTQKIGK